MVVFFCFSIQHGESKVGKIIGVLGVFVGCAAILAVHGWETQEEILTLKGEVIDVKLQHSTERLSAFAQATAGMADVPM
jgi:hypothetical protein